MARKPEPLAFHAGWRAVGFELAGGGEAGRRFVDALELLCHVAKLGDARSLAVHPASTTHSQLSPEDQSATSVSEGYANLSAAA